MSQFNSQMILKCLIYQTFFYCTYFSMVLRMSEFPCLFTWMWTIFRVFIESVTISLLFYVLFGFGIFFAPKACEILTS